MSSILTRLQKFSKSKNLLSLLPYLLLLLLSLPAIHDLLLPGYFPMHDDLQILRLEQLNECVFDLQLPCRWIPDAGLGYGYPMFNYYPPLPYYLAEAFHLFGVNLFWSIKIVFLLAFVLSAFFMYKFVSRFLNPLSGFVAAVFYLYAPYHSVDIYVRGAMNEAWGLVWFPLILHYSHQLITQKSKRLPIAALALSYGALLLSHNVMTLIFTPILGLWSLYWLFVTKNYRRFLPLLLSGFWAIGLAAFFFIPVAFEKNLVHVESMTIGYFNYMAHFADLNQMFFSRFWGYGGSIWGPEDGMAFPIGQFHWGFGFLAVLAAAFLFLKKYLRSKKIDPVVFTAFPILLITIFYIFLIHPRSIFIWDNLPLLYFAQFPWRLLAIPAFTFSLLVGYLIFFTRSLPKIIPYSLSALLIASVILWNLPFFKIQKQVVVTREEKLSGALWELQTTGGIFDYLPDAAPKPPADPAFTNPEFLKGEGSTLRLRKTTNTYSFDVRVASDSATVMVPVFDYPNWRVFVDQKQITHTHEDELGRIQFDLSGGDHQVFLKLYNTPVRSLSNILSLLSLLVLIYYFYQRKHESRHSL